MTTAVAHSRPQLPLPDTVIKGQILWPYAIAIGGIHLIALAAFVPWLFTWTGLVVCLVGVHVFGQAINLCYHRVLTHKSAKLPVWLEHLFVLMALCCMQDTPAKWVAIHRYHHNHSDHQDDPHTPLVEFLWAHVGWLLVVNKATHNINTYAKFASDILKDRWYMKLEKSFNWLWIYVAHAALFFAVGAGIGYVQGGADEALRFGLSLLVWGVFVRNVLVWHITWSVNSLTHMFGYQNHKTDDHSKNNWFVAVLTVGEGWHNNHHADPISASNQHRWWEFDITYYQIKALEWLGLAKDVKPPRHVRQKRRLATSGPEASE